MNKPSSLDAALERRAMQQGMNTTPVFKENSLDIQVGGNHYKELKIQPTVYNHANHIPFIEGNIIKYVTRWKKKGGIADLEKARHCIDMLIELENSNGE